MLSSLGPDFGYFPNDKKCWIISKPYKKESVAEVFMEMYINVTVEGKKHLCLYFKHEVHEFTMSYTYNNPLRKLTLIMQLKSTFLDYVFMDIDLDPPEKLIRS